VTLLWDRTDVKISRLYRAVFAASEDQQGSAVGPLNPNIFSVKADIPVRQPGARTALTSLQMPSVIKSDEKDLAEGRQALLQLTNIQRVAEVTGRSRRFILGGKPMSKSDVAPRCSDQSGRTSAPIMAHFAQTPSGRFSCLSGGNTTAKWISICQ
jgi:hypothetical protein